MLDLISLVQMVRSWCLVYVLLKFLLKMRISFDLVWNWYWHQPDIIYFGIYCNVVKWDMIWAVKIPKLFLYGSNSILRYKGNSLTFRTMAPVSHIPNYVCMAWQLLTSVKPWYVYCVQCIVHNDRHLYKMLLVSYQGHNAVLCKVQYARLGLL